MIAKFSKIIKIFLFLCWCQSVTAESQSRTLILESSLNSALGESGAAAYAKVIDPSQQILWTVFLPNSKPQAMLVFISPEANAKPQQSWLDVLNKMGVVWVGAENYGNDKANMQRILSALIGAEYATQELSLPDLPRFVAGMSGGGRVSSIIVEQFPDAFEGAVFMLGVNRPESLSQEQVALLNQRRYVFLTGKKDFNRRETKLAFKDYQSAGIKNIKLIDVPGLAHRYPDAKDFREALEYLTGVNP